MYGVLGFHREASTSWVCCVLSKCERRRVFRSRSWTHSTVVIIQQQPASARNTKPRRDTLKWHTLTRFLLLFFHSYRYSRARLTLARHLTPVSRSKCWRHVFQEKPHRFQVREQNAVKNNFRVFWKRFGSKRCRGKRMKGRRLKQCNWTRNDSVCTDTSAINSRPSYIKFLKTHYHGSLGNWTHRTPGRVV